MDNKLTLSVGCLPKLPKALSKPQYHGTKGKLWYHEFTHNNCMPVHFDVICSICFWCVGFTIVFLCVQKSRDLVKFAGFLREKTCGFLFWKETVLPRRMRKNTCVFIYSRCKVLKTCLFNPRNHSQFGPLVSLIVSLIVSFITQPRHKMPLHNAMFLPLVIVLSGPLLDHFSGEPNLSDRNLVTVLQLNGSKVTLAFGDKHGFCSTRNTSKIDQ